ncbi:MAG: sensor domain-containing diguanylate cyclase [Nitrospirae bacterium]|nr:sensor domain-containing diguanylate cyclase [Nitrospirota bacterium]
MNKIILAGLVLYTLSSGLGFFLVPEPSNLHLAIWLTGYIVLVLTVSYESFFSDARLNFFPFIVLAVVLLNFFVQITGGSHSPLWPAYFLFAVMIAAFAPLIQTYGTICLILGIESSNLFLSGQWQPERWPVYAGFGASLSGLSIAIAHIMHRTRQETAQLKDAHERLIAHADALDPLAETNTLESLMGRQTAAVSAALERESTFNGLIDMIAHFVPAHSYALFLKERGEVFVLRAIKSESDHAILPVGTELRGKTYIDVCAEQKQRQYISDISGMGTPIANLGYYRHDVRNVPIKTFLAIPVVHDGNTIGVIAVDSLEPGAFSLEDQDIFGYFETFFIQIIEKIQLSLKLRSRADHFRTLHEISSDLNSSLRFGEIMDKVIPRIQQLVPFDFCACVLKTEEEGKPYLLFIALHGYDAKLINTAFPFEDSALATSMQKHWQEGGIISHYAPDLGDRGRDIGLFPFKELQKPIKSLYGRLLIAKDDCIGVFFFSSLKTDAFTDYHRGPLLDTLMNQISMVAYNSLLYQRIGDLARTDGLTGLLNHRTFMEKLSEEYRRIDRDVRPFSILLMDIDKFKNVNDAYGHPVGDIALKAVAKVLEDTGRGSDFVARYGGEEFAIGMVDTNIKGAEQMAERVRKLIEKTVAARVGSNDLMLTLSIGVSSFPEDTKNKADLVTLADNALYHAKRLGRNRVCLHRNVKDAEPAPSKLDV